MRALRSLAALALLALLGGSAVRLQAQTPGPTVYTAFGDSVTAGNGDETGKGGYPPRLQALLEDGGANAQVRSRGVPGETTPEGLARVNSVLAEGGDVFLLMEGTNDIAQSISGDTTIFNLRQMGLRARQKGFDPYLATLIPRQPYARHDHQNIQTRRLAQYIRDEAGTHGWGSVECFDTFLRIPDVFDTHYAQDPSDPVGHPNATGYDFMAELFADVLLDVDSIPPVLGLTQPVMFTTEVPRNTNIQMEIWDFGAGLDLDATRIAVNGIPVVAEISGNGDRASIFYNPPGPLSGEIVVQLQSQDLASPPNTIDEDVFAFVVEGAGQPLVGDVDGSGRVDGVDLILLALAYGSAAGDARYNPGADLDGNGIVDAADLSLLSKNFGLS